METRQLAVAADLRNMSDQIAAAREKEWNEQLDLAAKKLIGKIECRLANLTEDDKFYGRVSIVLTDKEMRALSFRENLIFETFCPRGFNFHKNDPDVMRRIDYGYYLGSPDRVYRVPDPSEYRTIIINDSEYGSLNATWKKKKQLAELRRESERPEPTVSDYLSWLGACVVVLILGCAIIGIPIAALIWGFVWLLNKFYSSFGSWQAATFALVCSFLIVGMATSSHK